MDTEATLDKTIACIDNEFIKALAEPSRIEILKQLILHGASDVKTLANHLPQDRSVVSRHLATMEKAGLLRAEKNGRHVIYSIDGDSTMHKSELLMRTLRECFALGCC